MPSREETVASPEREPRRPLLRVRDLTVRFPLDGGRIVHAVQGVRFDIHEGEAVGILGESGCGKTTLALSLLRLLPRNARVVDGSVQFRGRELLNLRERQLEGIRGAQISAIFQEPAASLSPFLRVATQVSDVLRAHRGWSRRRCRREAESVLGEARLGQSPRLSASYPHELSGGQRQRAAIALALACRPALLIADEPSSSLDAALQEEILTVLKEQKRARALSLLFISHSPATLAKIADRLLVMYAGRIVERGRLEQVLGNPLHPYTKGLLQSSPGTVPAGRPRARLPALPGSPPDLARPSAGCAFEPRCPERLEACARREPEEVEPAASRRVRCFRYGG